jgi:hypothetical protein
MTPRSPPEESKPVLLVWCAAVVLVALYRVLPHPWNVSPVGALFLLGGLYRPRVWSGWAVPLAAVLISDLVIDAAAHHAFQAGRLIDYLGFGLVYGLGRAATGRGFGAKAASLVLMSLTFFLVSNFGVWLATSLYPHTLAGLADCYVAGVPFVRGTVAGDWLFAVSGMLATEGAALLIGQRRPAAPVAVSARLSGEAR